MNARKDPGITLQMTSGRMLNLLAIEAGDISITDIAHALSMTCRFNGHTRTFHSVAHHSLLVASLCAPEFALEALLHDASEAYTGDLPTPIKHRAEMAGFRAIEDHITSVIRRKFGLPQAESPEVKAADRMALAWERRDLMQPHPSVPRTPGLPVFVIQTMTPAAAEHEFLAAFRILASRRSQTTHSTATWRTTWEAGC